MNMDQLENFTALLSWSALPWDSETEWSLFQVHSSSVKTVELIFKQISGMTSNQKAEEATC